MNGLGVSGIIPKVRIPNIACPWASAVLSVLCTLAHLIYERGTIGFFSL